PWTGLAPDANAGSPLRILSQLGTMVTFPRVYVDTLRVVLSDGYAAVVVGFAVVAVVISFVLAVVHLTPGPFPPASTRVKEEKGDQIDKPQALGQPIPGILTRREFGILVLLAVVMVLSTALVGTSNQIGQEYLDRITFGRAAGIMLLYV